MSTIPLMLSGKLIEAAAFTTPRTTAAPAMSARISSIPRAADKQRPPVSKVTPFPEDI